MDAASRNLKRVLALGAVGVVVLAMITTVSNSLDSGDGDGDAPRAAVVDRPNDSSDPPNKPPQEYQVKEGDTLTAIAAETGITVDEIIALNKDVDPQTLNAGQVLKLR